jgi:hypothetical protein
MDLAPGCFRAQDHPCARALPGGVRDSTFGQVDSEIRVLRSVFDCGDAKGGRHPDVILDYPDHPPSGGGDQATLLAPRCAHVRGICLRLPAGDRLGCRSCNDHASEAGSVPDDAEHAATPATGAELRPAARAAATSATCATSATSAASSSDHGRAASTASARPRRRTAATHCTPGPLARPGSRQRLCGPAHAPGPEATGTPT